MRVRRRTWVDPYKDFLAALEGIEAVRVRHTLRATIAEAGFSGPRDYRRDRGRSSAAGAYRGGSGRTYRTSSPLDRARTSRRNLLVCSGSITSAPAGGGQSVNRSCRASGTNGTTSLAHREFGNKLRSKGADRWSSLVPSHNRMKPTARTNSRLFS